MKHLLAFILFCFSTILWAQDSERKIESFQYNGKKVEYGIQLPGDFQQNSTYPVVVGPSDLEGDQQQSFYWNGVKDTNSWILIDFPIYKGDVKLTQAFFNHLRSRFNIEGNKFHAVCFSANSAGTFDLVMNMPEDFHSITGVAGNPGTKSEDRLSKLKDVKVMFVVGDRDTYWMNASKDRHQRLQKLNVDSRIEIIKNGQHVLTQLVGQGLLSRLNSLR
ncbi:hypothetical protein [Roseivirga sp.]|uniref:hypothetical protein n=1 Tax=Roseivirga sp. TaxID=1964215 RepID=UPI003B526C47